MFQNKRVFVTGGVGVIGTALVEKLNMMKANILVGDLKPKPSRWNNNIQYRKGDLNYISKEEIMRFNPEYVFHLAATFERSIETYEFWDENQRHNLNLSHHLLNCIKDCYSLKKVIFASSYLVYNPKLYFSNTPKMYPYKIKERDSINPRNICGSAKLYHETEYEFLNQFKQTKFQFTCARIFRVYGKNSRDIISRWIRALLENKSIQVYNEENFFDYIYADDVAEGLIKLANSSSSGIVNLGSGKSTKIKEVLSTLKKEFPNAKIKYLKAILPYESSEADMALFQKYTKWIPKTKIDNGIKKIIKFEKNNKKQYNKHTLSNILITSISNKIPLINVVKNSMRKIGNENIVVGGDIDKKCIGKYFVDKFWAMPRLEELKINEIIKFCKKNEISHIIPTRDGELSYFAKNKEILLKNKIHVMISDLKGIENVFDKIKFYKQCKKNKISVIETFENIQETNYSKYVVKERFGSGSNKIGLKLSKKEAIMKAKMLKNPIFQPTIYGKEFTVDVFVDKKNNVKGTITRSRDKIVNGEAHITTTVKKPKLEKICAKLVKNFKLFGHVNIQAIEQKENQFSIIECNPRFGGASTLSIESGLDSFYWFFLETTGNKLTEYPFLPKSINKKQIRYPQNFFI